MSDINSIVRSLLPGNFESWCKSYKGKQKIIHDAVWGTFSLEDYEIALIDTPLLQRLRFIKQTGATYLTYPAAIHTRFEHSLGVLHHATRIYDRLHKLDPDHRVVDTSLRRNLRFAALMHDVGHGPFSHTSEQYYASMADIVTLKSTDGRYEHSGAGEVLSCEIVRCASFQQFIATMSSVMGVRIEGELVANIISGSLTKREWYKGEAIHGPFDADKLDYMHRDGLFSGLRMHIDLDRLYASISISEGIDEGELCVRLAGSARGTSPLMQIMFNKMLLYNGMYHHHKVRAVDCMLWALFDIALKRRAKIGGSKIKSVYDFLQLTDDKLLIPELCDNNDGRDIIEAIRDRRLWKRALVISGRTVTDEMHLTTKGTGKKGLFGAFVLLNGNETEKVEERREIARKIWFEAGRPCKQHEVWLDIPEPPRVREGQQMWICVKDADGQDSHIKLEELLPLSDWVELYEAHRWQSHVFCPSGCRQIISNAARLVLDRRFGLKFQDSAWKDLGLS